MHEDGKFPIAKLVEFKRSSLDSKRCHAANVANFAA